MKISGRAARCNAISLFRACARCHTTPAPDDAYSTRISEAVCSSICVTGCVSAQIEQLPIWPRSSSDKQPLRKASTTSDSRSHQARFISSLLPLPAAQPLFFSHETATSARSSREAPSPQQSQHGSSLPHTPAKAARAPAASTPASPPAHPSAYQHRRQTHPQQDPAKVHHLADVDTQ